jgi:hypothetical protein
MLTIRSEELSLQAIQSPRLRSVYQHWTAIRGARALPARRDVDPLEMRGALGILMIARYEPAHDDFRVSLFGTELARLRCGDATGRLIGTLQPPRYAAFVRQHYRKVMDAGLPSLDRVVLAAGAPLVDYTRLALPLAESGDTAEAVLVAAEFHKDMWNMLYEAAELSDQAVG